MCAMQGGEPTTEAGGALETDVGLGATPLSRAALGLRVAAVLAWLHVALRVVWMTYFLVVALGYCVFMVPAAGIPWFAYLAWRCDKAAHGSVAAFSRLPWALALPILECVLAGAGAMYIAADELFHPGFFSGLAIPLLALGLVHLASVGPFAVLAWMRGRGETRAWLFEALADEPARSIGLP